MYQMRIAILMLLLLWPAYSQGAQYSEGACLLLQQQMERFSNQKQSFNYRNARYEYEKNCLAKPAAKPRPAVTSQHDVTPAPTQQTANTAIQGSQSEQAAKPSPKQDAEEVAKQGAAKSAADTASATTPATVVAKDSEAGPAVEKTATEAKPLPASAAVTADTSADITGAAAAKSNTSAAVTASTSTSNASDPAKLPARTVPVATAAAESPLLVVVESLLLNLPLISASIMALLMFVFLLTSWLGLNLPGFKGVFAEYKLNRLLRWRLKQPYYHFRKLHLYNAKDERVVIDHLVLSPYGIFVISVQNYRGQITGSEMQANWTRLYLGNKKQFMNPLHQNFKNTEAVRHYLQIKPAGMEQLFSVVAFSRLVKFGNEMPAHLCYIDKVSDYVRQFNEPCFVAEQLTRFKALLHKASKEH